MSNFSRYLEAGEVLLLAFGGKSQKQRLYYHLFLLLLAFFVIYPLWRFGRQGFYFWAVLVAYLFIRILGDFLKEKDTYLLSNRRLLYLAAINNKDFRVKRSLSLNKITRVKKKGRSSLVLLINNRPYYLSSIEKRNKVFYLLQIYLKEQNLL